MNIIVVLVVALFPLLVMADILQSPLPSQMPLHRIGYEIVFEILVASAAGAAAVRALVKNRWKFGDETTSEDRAEADRKIENVLPRLKELMGNATIRDTYGGYSSSSVLNFARKIERVLLEHTDLREALKGVPIEWLYEVLDREGWNACADMRIPPWKTHDDEMALEVKNGWFSKNVLIVRHMIEMAKKKERERKARLRFRILSVLALIAVVIVAWLIGYYI